MVPPIPSTSTAGPSTYRSNVQLTLTPLVPDDPNFGQSLHQEDQDGMMMEFTDAQIDDWKEQDRYLPIANVGRIMRNTLPSNAKIAKDAKECIQECVSEFISFLSSEAAEKVLTDKRKTINGEDIIHSMTVLGFDNYSEACRVYLAKYRVWLNENSTQSRLSSRYPSPSAPAAESSSSAPHGSAHKQSQSRSKSRPSSGSGSIDSPDEEEGDEDEDEGDGDDDRDVQKGAQGNKGAGGKPGRKRKAAAKEGGKEGTKKRKL